VVLSKRERYIAIAAGLVIGALALDWMVVEPLLVRRDALDADIANQREDLDRANKLFRTSRDLSRQWAQVAAGQMQHNASEAESQVQNAVREWAQDAGVSLSSVTPARSDKEKDFQKITFRAAASGGMQQVARFVYRVQYADIPVRVTDLTVSSRREGGQNDELTLNLGITTIWQPPAAREGQQ
jgi:hypothetical protein